MAGIDWEQRLLDKLQRLAGDKLAAAAEALSHAGEITQKLFVNATDDIAIKMVEDLIKLRAGAPWQGKRKGAGTTVCRRGYMHVHMPDKARARA